MRNIVKEVFRRFNCVQDNYSNLKGKYFTVTNEEFRKLDKFVHSLFTDPILSEIHEEPEDYLNILY